MTFSGEDDCAICIANKNSSVNEGDYEIAQ